MRLGPSLDSCRQESVTEAEGGRSKGVDDCRVNSRVISVPVALLLRQQTELLHHVFAEDDRQELVVGDVLNDGDVDSARLLEQRLVVPMWVNVRQLSGHSVVLASHQRVHAGEYELFINTDFAGFKAEPGDKMRGKSSLVGESARKKSN